MKRRGIIKATVDVVRSAERARYIIESSVIYRDNGFWRIVTNSERAEVIASVMAYDACGSLVWSKTKDDSDFFGHVKGPVETAQKVAASFKEALAKRNSRLNRASPCSQGP